MPEDNGWANDFDEPVADQTPVVAQKEEKTEDQDGWANDFDEPVAAKQTTIKEVSKVDAAEVTEKGGDDFGYFVNFDQE